MNANHFAANNMGAHVRSHYELLNVDGTLTWSIVVELMGADLAGISAHATDGLRYGALLSGEASELAGV